MNRTRTAIHSLHIHFAITLIFLMSFVQLINSSSIILGPDDKSRNSGASKNDPCMQDRDGEITSNVKCYSKGKTDEYEDQPLKLAYTF